MIETNKNKKTGILLEPLEENRLIVVKESLCINPIPNYHRHYESS